MTIQTPIVGINTSPGGYSTAAQEYRNILKNVTGWYAVDNSNVGTNEQYLLYTQFLDSNQYPITLTGGPAHNFTRLAFTNYLSTARGHAEFGDPPYYPGGRYIFKYTGEMTCQFLAGAAFFAETGPNGEAGGKGRILVDLTPNNDGFKFILLTMNDANPPRNFQMFRAPTATATVIDPLEALALDERANVLDPLYKAKLSGMNTGVIRFMGGQAVMGNFHKTWADRQVTNFDSVFWSSGAAGTIAHATNVDSEGESSTNDGMPVEACLRIANEMNCHPWLCEPFLADANHAQQMAQMTLDILNPGLSVIVEQGNEWWNGNFAWVYYAHGTFTITGDQLTVDNSLTPYNGIDPSGYALHAGLSLFDPTWSGLIPDRVWITGQISGTPGREGVYQLNTALPNATLAVGLSHQGGAEIARQAEAEWTRASIDKWSIGNSAMSMQIKHATEHGQIWRDTFTAGGGDPDRVIRALGGQHAYITRCQDFLDQTTAGTGGVITGGWTGAAYEHVDVLATAPYPPYNPYDQTINPTTETLDQLFAGLMQSDPTLDNGAGNLGVAIRDTATLKGICNARTNALGRTIKLYFYEGGQNYVSQVDFGSPRFELFESAQYDPRMGDFTKQLIDGCISAGCDAFCYFMDIAAPGPWGHWGAWEQLLEGSTPKGDAILDRMGYYNTGTGGGTLPSTVNWNYILDHGLVALGGANQLLICSQQPTTYTEATSTYKLGTSAATVFGAPADDVATGGRKVSSNAITAGGVTVTGTGSAWAAVDTVNVRLLAFGPVAASHSVSSGDAFSLPSFDVAAHG